MNKIEKEEKLLISKGFKKKWLSDMSGYWYEKKVHKLFTYYSDPRMGHYLIEHEKCNDEIRFKSLNALLKSMKKFKFVY